MIKKIKILIVTVFLTAFGGVTYASFTDGLNAAIEGDYKTALKEWQSFFTYSIYSPDRLAVN